MIVLGADSSALSASAALTVDKKVVASFTVDAGNTHSTTLLPMIKACLDSAGVSVGDVDLFAVSQGPGSFTGVRIGVSTVKGLCAPANVPCVGVSSLGAMAHSFSLCAGLVVPVMDARRGNVYAAVFSADGNGICRKTEDMIIPAAELCDMLGDSPVFFLGDACDSLTALAREKGLDARSVPHSLRAANAAGVCALAEEEYTAAKDTSVYTAAALAPIYLRPGRAGNAPLPEG